MFVGWDWASTTHDVTVLDDAGAVVDRWASRHTEQDLAAALDRLARHEDPAGLPVIIERSSGLVVDRLVAAGHPVVPVHPTAFRAAHPRWGASGAKSDAGDSYKLADYLRTDGHRLRRLDRSDPGLQELQALVRLREDHVRARTAASNQLGALLEAHWPGPKAVFYRLASPIALAFLAEYPTPQAAARLGEAGMASFCRRHSYRGGKPPAALLARLRSAPTAPVGVPTATLVLQIESQVQLLHTLLATMPSSRQRSPSASPATHGPSCWPRCLGSAPSTSPSCWPRSGRSWTASTAPSTPPPSAAPRRSPRPPARPAGSTSAGPPTVEPARP
jgi:hypothetical protein